MKPFLEKTSTPESFSGIPFHMYDDGCRTHLEMVFDDVCMNTSVYRLKDDKSDLIYMQSHIGLTLGSFVSNFNSLKQDYRSILIDKIPGIIELIEASFQPREEEKPFFKDEGRYLDAILPFTINNENDRNTVKRALINFSLQFVSDLLVMLIAIRTERFNFIDLSDICSIYPHLNDVSFLYHAYETIPESMN